MGRTAVLLDREDLPGDVRADPALQPVLEWAFEPGDGRDRTVGEPEAGGEICLALANPLRSLGDCSDDCSPVCRRQGTMLRAEVGTYLPGKAGRLASRTEEDAVRLEDYKRIHLS